MPSSTDMSSLVPVSALVATLLPVGVALRAGERPGLAVMGGAAACLAAIVLVSMDPAEGSRGPARGPRGAACCTARRRAGFGMFFVLVREAANQGAHQGAGWGGLWPLVASRGAGAWSCSWRRRRPGPGCSSGDPTLGRR